MVQTAAALEILKQQNKTRKFPRHNFTHTLVLKNKSKILTFTTFQWKFLGYVSTHCDLSFKFLLSFAGNPLICSCQSYVQKIWLRQHRKWLSTQKRGSKVGPQCTEPTPILDRYLLTVKDSELCPLPSVNSLQLSHIKPHSFLLTWDSPDTNMTGLKGFIVAYHRLDMNDQVIKSPFLLSFLLSLPHLLSRSFHQKTNPTMWKNHKKFPISSVSVGFSILRLHSESVLT